MAIACHCNCKKQLNCLLSGDWDTLLSTLVSSYWGYEDLDDRALGTNASLGVAVFALAHLKMSLEGRLARASDAFPVAVAVAGSAFSSASRPGTVDLRVLAASDLGVYLVLDEGSALLASVFGEDADGTGAAELVALGLGTPGAPLGELAVDGALVGHARSTVRKLGADGTTVVGKLGDKTGAGLLASTAGLGAFAVLAPLSNGAVDRAPVLATLAGSLHGGALATTEGSLGHDRAVAGLSAGTTGLSAFAPGTEDGGAAVTGAGLGVAATRRRESGAGFTTIASEANYLALFPGATTAAGLGAHTPGSELGDCAVDGAPLSVATGGFEEGRALNTTVGCFYLDGAVGSLGTTVASLGAEAEGTPFGHGAVNGAEAGVTVGLSDEAGADVAVELRLGGDFTGLELSADAAGNGALGHGAPVGDLAVNGAGLGAAVTGLGEERALLSAVSDVAEDLAFVGLGALLLGAVFGASLGASGPFTPGSDDAVNGALVGFALFLLEEGRAGVATVFALPDDLAEAGAGADATGLGALGPAGPAGNPAVHGADADGARTCLFQGGAFLATIAGLGEDVASALLVTAAAGLVASGPGVPVFHDAVNGAGLDVAGNLGILNTAEFAAELRTSEDTASAAHGTTTA